MAVGNCRLKGGLEMDSEQLKDILTKHKAWLNGENDGVRADLRDADLSGADLSGADLSGADLRDADLSGADLSGADLRDADLIGADLSNVKCNGSTCGYFLACPQIGSFIGFKKASGYIVVLEIPADAQRSSATTLKCRCDKAKVLRIENLDGSISEKKSIASNYDEKFIYTVGETVQVEGFDTDRWNECSRGIHFFLSRELAVQY